MSAVLTSLTQHFLRASKMAFQGAIVLGLTLLFGFGLFLVLLSSYPSSPQSLDSLPEADALVLLTGGPGRIEEGFRLLHHNKGKKLFISGVSPKVRRRDLLSVRGIYQSPASDHVVLGHNASNTHENALEIRQWVEAQSLDTDESGIQAICVISSFYHLPRCLLELGAVLNNISLIPYGVGPHTSVWRLLWSDPYYRKRMIQEYIKCIAVLGKRLLRGWGS